jgi:hypothetical protein
MSRANQINAVSATKGVRLGWRRISGANSDSTRHPIFSLPTNFSTLFRRPALGGLSPTNLQSFLWVEWAPWITSLKIDFVGGYSLASSDGSTYESSGSITTGTVTRSSIREFVQVFQESGSWPLTGSAGSERWAALLSLTDIQLGTQTASIFPACKFNPLSQWPTLITWGRPFPVTGSITYTKDSVPEGAITNPTGHEMIGGSTLGVFAANDRPADTTGTIFAPANRQRGEPVVLGQALSQWGAPPNLRNPSIISRLRYLAVGGRNIIPVMQTVTFS